jgi:AraC-like DNA-binding protein
MRRAASLLISTDRKMELLARSVGYQDPFAFSTAFKRHFGLSRTQYRAQN